MGQTSSTPASAADTPTVSRQLENFFHVCNIIPDTPQHHRRQWTAPTGQPTTRPRAHAAAPAPASPPSVAPRRGAGARHRRRSGGGTGDLSTTDYTTDDESDAYVRGRRHRHRHRHRRHGHRHRATHSDSDASSVAGDELLREAPAPAPASHHHHASTRHRDATPDAAAAAGVPATTSQTLPLTLDRRYDLDVAPSMVNMNLQWNGAYMVAALLYNEIAVKYGYRHLLSVQQLHWEAVRRYYQLPRIDAKGHYKVSLGALLDVIQSVALRSERELSVYADLTGTDGGTVTQPEYAADASGADATRAQRPPSTAVRLARPQGDG